MIEQVFRSGRVVRRLRGSRLGSAFDDLVAYLSERGHSACHGSLGLCTPYEVHHGLAIATLARRATILDAAFVAHPERFPRGRPLPQSLPTEVWINKPGPEVSTDNTAQ